MTAPVLQQPDLTLQRGGRPAGLFAAIGVLAVVALGFGFASAPGRAFHAYLAAHAFATSLTLGSIAFVMISHAANTTWPVALRRVPEAIGATMPWLALAFLPVAFGLRELYPWTHPDDYAEPVRHALHHRQPIMNPAAWGVRAIVYLAVWSALGLALYRNSVAMERGADRRRCERRLRRISYAGLPIGGLTAGFAAYDWYMSLSPEFASTMFAGMWIAICLHAGVAVTIVALWLLQRTEPRLPLNDSHCYALGRLLFAFLIFLGYTSFFQYMLVWMANRPGEAAWYLERVHGGHQWVPWFLILGEFGVPFFALLSYRAKRSLRSLAPIALYCLAALYVHVNWLITPSLDAEGVSWLDLAALSALLCFLAASTLLHLRGKSLAPIADARYAASLEYRSR